MKTFFLPCRQLAVLPLWAGVTVAGFAQTDPSEDGREALPNFDRRVPAPAAVPSTVTAGAQSGSAASVNPRAQALAALAQAAPGARVEPHAITGAPAFVGSHRGFLTAPSAAAASAVPGAPAPAIVVDAPATVRDFVDRYPAVFGHRSDVLTRARVRREYVTRHNGLRTVIWEQRLDDIPIFEALFQAHVTARGELVNIASGLVPDPETAASRTAAARAALASAPPITAAEAIARAARTLGDTLAASGVTAVDTAQGSERRQRFTAAPLSDPTVQLVWLPLSGSALRLCWEVICTSRARGEMFRVIVDAESGEALVRHGLTEYISNASYRVFTSDSPTPFSPGHATPSTEQPPTVARSLVTLSALSVTASPNGWINDGVMETRGNNVDAHTDTNADNVADLPRPQATGANRVFDPALDLTQAPSTYQDAAVVNLFYWCNWMHDQLYDLGFDEAAGNFQVDNFGRGGIGNDPLMADAQDGSGTNNANFSSPPDGTSPRMQMFIWTGPTPDRDGDFDAEVVLHEYAHGLSNRLVGGGVGISALASRGLGEGWSDFYGIALLGEAGDDLDGNWARGGYARYGASSGTFFQNYYFGGRRYPYSTNLAKNPLTFKDIDPTQASPHTGIPVNPIVGSQADEVHNSGEVWCVTLWDARANLIRKHGFATGHRLVLQLVTDGMKLSPANPNFLQARDAILQADLVATGGANRAELWAAFAKRGMGFNASAPVSTTTTGLVENFDLPDDLLVTPMDPIALVAEVGGPFGAVTQSLSFTNTGTAALHWTAVRTQSWLAASPASGTLAAGATATVTLSLVTTAANALPVGVYADTLAITNVTSGRVQAKAVSLSLQPPRLLAFALDTDPAWSRTGEWAFGQPSGGGGVARPFPDPTRGATGNNVFGINLSGDYAVAVGGFAYLTAGPFNLTGYANSRLVFQRWLNTDLSGFTAATIEVSRNGTTWTKLWENGSSSIRSNAWTKVQHDLAPVADNQPSVFVRWGHAVNSTGAFPYSGWNIDDIEILAQPGASPAVITSQPVSQVATVGANVSFTVGATGLPVPTYQWQLDGVLLPGATNATLTVNNAQIAHAGAYTVVVANSINSVTSNVALLSGSAAAPAITPLPAQVVGTVGQSATLTVAATGTAPLTYQWRRNGIAIANATHASYTLATLARTHADYYDAIVATGLSARVSSTVRLSVAPTTYPTLVTPDPAWDFGPESVTNGTGFAVVAIADGRAYVAGDFLYLGVRRTSVARITEDGTVDATFVPPELVGAVRALAVQADGKLLIGGDFVRINGATRGRIARLNTDGSLDSAFDAGSGADGAVLALAVQGDGRVVVGGSFTAFGGSARSRLMRLQANGTADDTFQNRGVSSTVNALAVQADGKIVAGGIFSTFFDASGAATPRSSLLRLQPNGSLDTLFAPAPSGAVQTLALQSNGLILVGGTFTAVSGTSAGRIARLQLDGTLDTTFAGVTSVGFGSTSSAVSALAVQPDGRILVGGSFTLFNNTTANRFARLNGDGSRDPSFVAGGFGGAVNGVAILSTGRILAVGAFTTYLSASGGSTNRSRLARLNADGSLDTGVNFTVRGPGSVNATLPLANGQTLAMGFFTALRSGASTAIIARLQPSGAVDPTFNAGGFGANSNVYAAAEQVDGKIIIVGAFTTYNGSAASRIARLHPNGTLDPTFDAGAGLSGTAYAVALLPGGRIAVSGTFITVQGVSRNRVAVLHANGQLDASFDPGAGASGSVYSLLAQPDGKLLIGGLFSTYNGTGAGRIARLNRNGSLDTSFAASAGASSDVYSLALQADGKILLGGTFSAFAGTSRSGVARLHADGSLDTGFVPPTVGTVLNLLAQEDGKVILRGPFTSINGAPRTAYLARLQANGTHDESFAAVGFNSITASPSAMRMRDGGELMFHNVGTGFASTRAATLPAIATPPPDRTASIGGSATWAVTAAVNVLPLTYQWRFNGAPLPGATEATLVLHNLQANQAGAYAVTVGSEFGAITSAAGTLSLAPAIVSQFASRWVGLGGATRFEVAATGGTPLSYQWRKDGLPLAGATTASFLIPAVTLSDAGSYSVVVSDVSGATPSLPGILTLLPNPLGYSSRHQIDPSGVRAYFAITGSEPKRVLLRALGPTLATLGVTGVMADPALELADASGAIVATNNDWGPVAAVNLPDLFTRVGAVALLAGSKDALLDVTLAPGSYAVRVYGVGGATGVALLELFDADTNPRSRLAYVGVRGWIDPASGGSISGLTLVNSAQKRLLLRAVGPALGNASAHPNPQVQVLAGATVVAQNDDWGGAGPLASAAAQAGAFALPPASMDAAVFLDARIGSGTYALSAPAAGGAGEVLVEFYDLPAAGGGGGVAPLIVSPPSSQTPAVGGAVTLRAVVVGDAPLTYGWRRNGSPVAGATTATLSLAAAQAADAGGYVLRVTNAFGAAASAPAFVSVGDSAAHAALGGGYLPGATLTVTNTFSYTGVAAELGWKATLPAGWSYVSSDPAAGDVRPAAGATGVLQWGWTTPPPSPVAFTYTVRAPDPVSGPQPLSAEGIVRVGATTLRPPAQPEPLLIERVVTHSADTDRDFQLSLLELTRVIELYNTRHGTVRTGAYRVDVANVEDGFAADAPRAPGAAAALTRYHSADTRAATAGSGRDGAIDLFELTRVIELYNTRAGTVRTGAYHVLVGTEDGFAGGP